MIAEIQKLAKTAMFDDVLDVIKEEAAELIQAASKLQRAHSRTNPTDVGIVERNEDRTWGTEIQPGIFQTVYRKTEGEAMAQEDHGGSK